MSAKKFSEKLIEQKLFFERYNIDPQGYAHSGLNWKMLENIYAHYCSWWDYLHPIGQLFSNTLALEPGVHAANYRVKDPEHLVEKIIRKSGDQEFPWATYENYWKVTKDLIGVRALHIFKEDWSVVHASIKKHWRIEGKPEANVRETDPQHILDDFQREGCSINKHSSGYRSVHYEIVTSVLLKSISVEIQVRTLFEEAWGEASHKVKYPHCSDSPQIEDYLKIMSVNAGLVDNLGSAVNLLRSIENAPFVGERASVYRENKRRFSQLLLHIAQQPSMPGDLFKSVLALADDKLVKPKTQKARK